MAWDKFILSHLFYIIKASSCKKYLWLTAGVIAVAISVLFVEVRKKTKKDEYKSNWRRFVTIKATGKYRKEANRRMQVNLIFTNNLPYTIKQVRILIKYSYFPHIVEVC